MSVFLPIGNLQGGVDLPVTAGLALWFDGADISTMWQDETQTIPVASNDDEVGTWRDKAQNLDAIQATSSKRPLYKTSVKNGLSAVLGSIANVTILEHVGGSGLVSDEFFTAFVVANNTSSATIGTVWHTTRDKPGGRNVIWIDRRTQKRVCELSIGINYYLDYSAQDNTSDFRLLTVIHDSTNGEAWKNGVSQDSRSDMPSGDTANDAILLFQHGYEDEFTLNGHIAELIVYEAILSTEDRQTMEAYLTAKWAL